METIQLENVGELLKLARKRVALPRNYLEVKYSKDVDLLTIRFTDMSTTHSKGDIENGLIFNYDANGKLANVEILDLYGVFAEV